jgi:hypothetical protein
MRDIGNWEKRSLATLALGDSASRALAEVKRVSSYFDDIDQATKYLRIAAPFLAEFERQQALTLAADRLADYSKVSELINFASESILADIGLQQQALCAVLGRTVSVEKLFLTNSTALDAAVHFDAVNRPLLGPLADLRASGILSNSAAISDTQHILASVLGDYESRYRPSNMAELIGINAGLEHKTAFAALYAYEALQEATRIHSPWLEIENTVHSAIAFTELHSMGYALKTLEPFEGQLLSGLRTNLGDWRDQVTFPETVLGNLSMRSAFYLERGFRAELTDFPAAAFEESLESAEFIEELPTLVDTYGDPIEVAKDEDLSAFTRTNRAHLWLMCFETQFRKFIDMQMTRAFGENWPRHQLVGNQYEQWQDKKQKADAAGRPSRPLICYADFTDYALIICRRENWKVFEPFFKDPANIRESLQRLHLPRVETMHARPLSQEDELFLYAELKRLGRSLKKFSR